jgi:hypothetical protein
VIGTVNCQLEVSSNKQLGFDHFTPADLFGRVVVSGINQTVCFMQ